MYKKLLKKYEEALATQQFENVRPLISEDAVFWFNDGSFHGVEQIEDAFKETFGLIKEEKYWISDAQWIVESDDSAVCIYQFNWEGMIDGELESGNGRGTSVLKLDQGEWKIAHEHLSGNP